MPILRHRDVIEALGQPIDDRHRRIAVGDSQRAARAEIVLHVNDEQEVVTRLYLHLEPLSKLTSTTLAQNGGPDTRRNARS